MPIYEYRCECGYEVTELQVIGDEAPRCPQCGETMLKKLTFPAMVKIKGEGGFPSRRKEFKDTAPYYRG